MKRCIRMLFVAILCLITVVPRVHAYDFREDKLSDAPDAEAMLEQENAILDEILDAAIVVNASLDEETGAVDFDRAVKVYRYAPEDFLKELGNGTLVQKLPEHTWTVWLAPITGLSGTNYAVASLTGEGHSLEWSEQAQPQWSVLYEREAVDAVLSGHTFESLYILSVPQAYINFVAAVNGNDVEFLAYAARPEFLGIENGTWFTAEEVIELLDSEPDASVGALAGGGGDGSGGGGGLFSDETFVQFITIVVILVGGLLFGVIRLIRKKTAKK